MNAKIIDGKTIAAQWRARIGEQARQLTAAHGIMPGLAVLLVGDDPASGIYVGAKANAARELGFRSFDLRLPASIRESDLLAEIVTLNGDASVSGILVQMPLPDHIDPARIIAAIDPLKDVDGFHPMNVGRLASGEFGAKKGLVACTPLGCLILIKHALAGLAGAEAIVIGRSAVVGRPMVHLLLQESCTVTIAHSQTRDLPNVTKRADIVVAAVGQAEIVRGDWIKPGAVVIDVGTNRVAASEGKAKLVGDVAFAEVAARAAAITPVPGGVGPMTIAGLMRNTLIAAALQAGLTQPDL